MGKYLEIAQRVLEQSPRDCVEDRRVNADQSLATESIGVGENRRREISEICEISPVGDDVLREALEDDWDEVSNDPAQLEVARLWVTEAKQVANGIIPEHYTQTSDCKYCGPVFVVEGYPLQANNCPWCFNRIKCLPIPGHDR